MTDMLKKIRWLNVVLFFSLALNFFVAGYLASDTKVLHRFHKHKSEHKRPELMMVDYFPKTQRREIKAYMALNRDKFKASKRALFKNQKEILNLIGAETLDEAALRRAFQEQQAGYNQFQTELNEVLIRVIMGMDVEARKKTLERGKRAHERRKDR
ncbi:periplasmic heavy metal sensor [Paremcibacter congregatus]|uniref:periplasmic heavy metal sensor n=1 Tax=Paremcibacter congregatus TaxID=2043170 RepID=UPI0030ED39D5|tara:strand:+ start:18871 stop:19338 length:468 start_codon:yes stop_codon:yes gene_type:complete